MDFLTALAYISIVVLVLANILIVRRMKIDIRNEEDR